MVTQPTAKKKLAGSESPSASVNGPLSSRHEAKSDHTEATQAQDLESKISRLEEILRSKVIPGPTHLKSLLRGLRSCRRYSDLTPAERAALASDFKVRESTIQKDRKLAEFVLKLPEEAQEFFFAGEVSSVGEKSREIYLLLVERQDGLTSTEVPTALGDLALGKGAASKKLHDLEKGGHAVKTGEYRGKSFVYKHRRFVDKGALDGGRQLKGQKKPTPKKKQKGRFAIPSSRKAAFQRLHAIADELEPVLNAPTRYHFNFHLFKKLGGEVTQIIREFPREETDTASHFTSAGSSEIAGPVKGGFEGPQSATTFTE